MVMVVGTFTAVDFSDHIFVNVACFDYFGDTLVKTLIKAAGAIFWAVCMVVVAPFALLALGLFWLANGGFGELKGY